MIRRVDDEEPLTVRWYRSLYGRVALGYAVLLPILLGAQVAAVLALANQRDQSNGTERLERAQVARHLAQVVSERLDRSPHSPLAEVVAGLQPSNRLFVVMKNGEHYERRSPGADALNEFTTGLRALREFDQFPGDWSRSDYGAAPVLVGGRIAGLVGVTPRSMFERYGGTIVALVTVLLFLGNLALAILVIRPIRTRLRSLHRAAARLRDGHLEARATEQGTDELAEVARVFNEMATQLTKRTSDLETSDRLRRQLLADVSHELMTPLTSVLARLETLGMEDVDLNNDQRMAQISGATAEAQRLERLIGDLLAAARLESGGIDLSLEEVSLDELFAILIARHETECRKKNVRLSHDAGGLFVVGDRFRLDQALDNLMVNALRHTPSGGRIELRARQAGGTIRLTVWDSAGAIAPEHLPHIFDRFYKVESANGIASPGSGLGLSIVKAIVTRHRGHVAAASSPKEGTTLTIELPLRLSSAVAM